MKVTLSSRNLPPGHKQIWGRRDNGTMRCLGFIHRTRYGWWQASVDNGRGDQSLQDFRTLKEARDFAKRIWE